MKQETGKKNKKLLWIILAAVALLAAVGVALAIFLQPADPQNGDTDEEKPVSEVYWNIDRVKFTENAEVAGLSERTKSEDGLFHFRMASQGKLLDMATKDRKLVNYMDTLDVMGLVLDADGLVIDALDVKTIAVETAISYYVKAINGNMVTINSSVAMNGMDMTIELTDSTYIMDVRPGTETPGQSLALDVLDLVAVYGSEEVPAEAIYLLERTEASPLYLRVDQFYDSENVTTTRVPDKNGVYTIPFAINGKVEQLKCKDKGVVTGIDSGNDSNKVMGLTFDEEGYITGTIGAAAAARGKLVANVYHVTAIDGNAIEATRLMSGSEQGKVAKFTLTENTQIIMDEDGCGHFIGERVSGLQLNDTIIAWTDMGTDALYVLVCNRLVDFPMYYSYNPHGITAEGETSRAPDANGYYIFELATQGKCITAKTKDKALASKIDAESYSCQFFGLNVERGIIKEFYPVQCITGTRYGIGGATRFVTQVMGPIVQITANDTFTNITNYMISTETEVYDVSEYAGSKIGSKTTLQPGDRVVAARDPMNNLTHVYVLDRYYKGCKLYYNEQRDTARVPNAEGYYVYTVYCEGKKMEVKTKDKNIAAAIDAQNAPIVAMKVSNGIVKAAYPAIAASMYSAKRFNFNYVSAIASDKTVSCYTFSNGQRVDAAVSYKMAKNCKIYNVSTNFSDHRGEKTTLKVGDRIQAIQDYQTGELTHIWIMGRAMDAPLYMHYKRSSLSNGVTKRIPNAEGYYEVELFVDGKIKTFKTKSKDLMSQIDGYDEETFFTMETKGDIILKADVASSSIYGMNLVASQSDVMKISGKNITTVRMRPGAGNYGETVNFTINSKTKIYNVGYYAGDARWKADKLEKGDRVIVYGDRDGNISYIFIMYPQLHEKGYESKCPHCNKVVWWEPWTGGAISNVDVVHYYQPCDYNRNQGTIGKDPATNPDALRYTIVFDMNGKTITSSNRNFLVYTDLVLVDTVGGGVLEASGGGEGGNILVSGGTLTICDGITLRKSNTFGARASEGGNIAVTNNSDSGTTGKVILKDAKLEGWDCFDGGSILLNAGTELTVNKATVTGGDIHATKGAKVKLNGSNIQIRDEGIILDAGAKITESKLSGNSKVIVQASGIFTEKLSNVNEQKAYYEAERKHYPIEVRNGALWTERDPSKPDYVAEPAIPAKPALLKVDNSPLTLDAKNQAKCPVCNKVVTWTAITDTTKVHKLVNGNHYYLPKDLTFEKADVPFVQVADDQSACLHLNDHNITATKAMAIQVNGTLNVMGNGIVSGNGYADAALLADGKPGLHAATFEVWNSKAVANLYGGTYVKAAANTDHAVVEVHGNGGIINMFEGVTIDARGSNKNAVQSYWGMFNLYGGTVYGGETDAVWAGNWTDTKSGGISIYGGTIQSDAEKAVYAGGVANGPATLSIYGGQINGNTRYNANAQITIAGNPKLTRLTQPDSKDGVYEGKIILGKLTEGAYIPVFGTAEITYPNENAESYLKYFVSLTDDEIIVQNYAISFYYVPDPELPEVPEVMPAVTENLQFIEGSDWALCPLCEKYVKWAPVTQKVYGSAPLNNGDALSDGMHFYLAEDIVYSGTADFMTAPGGDATKVACFHLNGHNITGVSENIAHGSVGTLNIMGSGIVSGNNSLGATITINTTRDSGGIFLHSGTYTKASTNDTAVVQINANGGRVVVGKDATIVTEPGQLAAKVAGGNLTNGILVIEGTVKGGYVESAPLTVKPDLDCSVVLQIKDADLQGGAKIAKDTMLGLFGQTKINGLDLTSGAKIAESQLSGTAKVTVLANGIFTNKLANANEQKAYYEGGFVYYPVEVREGALWTDKDPSKPNFVAEPAIPAKPALLKTDNAALTLNNNEAKCPVCNEVVSWTAITDTNAVQFLTAGNHYYLTSDLTFEKADGPYIQVVAGQSACLHLNDHNITATNAMAIQVGGTLNIMGNGTVSGNGTSAIHAATLEAWNSRAVLNLYGGTYVKSAANSTSAVVEIYGDGGTINMFEGVIIDARNTNKNAVQSYWGMFNLYGGTVHGGLTHAIWAGNWNDTRSGGVSIYGGTVQSDADKAVYAGGVKNGPATANFFGGQINGNVAFNANTKIVVAGSPKLTKLTLPDSKEGVYEGKIILGKLTEGASIRVTGTGAITFQNEKVENYLKYFTSLTDEQIVVENYAISFHKAPEPEQPEDPTKPTIMKADNSPLTLDGNSQAKCPVCDQVVTWTAITDIAAVQSLEKGNHYYLPADLTYENTGDAYIKVAAGQRACLHLNDHNITATNAMTIQVSGILNIMGNGTVSGNGSSGVHAATLEAWNSKAVINLYGGNYVKSEANANCAVVEIHGDGGTINMLEGAVIDARNTKKNAVQCYWGMFNLYGGTVYGGITDAIWAGNWSSNKSGGVSIYGGTVQAGTGAAIYAGGVAGGPATLNLYGGQVITGRIRFGANVALAVSGNPVVEKLEIIDGLKLTLGEMTDGASVTVSANGVFTTQNPDAASYVQKGYFVPYEGYKDITVVDNALFTEQKPA